MKRIVFETEVPFIVLEIKCLLLIVDHSLTPALPHQPSVSLLFIRKVTFLLLGPKSCRPKYYMGHVKPNACVKLQSQWINLFRFRELNSAILEPVTTALLYTHSSIPMHRYAITNSSCIRAGGPAL